MKRLDLLVAIFAAFQGIQGTLTAEQADEGFAIVENEFGCDLDAVDAYLRAEMAALALACRAVS